jgi:hypothetical protein
VSPEEVAEAAVFLAADASSGSTGESIKVDTERFRRVAACKVSDIQEQFATMLDFLEADR